MKIHKEINLLWDKLAATERFCDYTAALDKYHAEQEKKQNRKISREEIIHEFNKTWFTIDNYKKYIPKKIFKVTFYNREMEKVASKIYDSNKILSEHAAEWNKELQEEIFNEKDKT